jgi:glutamyl-tRNA reductase
VTRSNDNGAAHSLQTQFRANMHLFSVGLNHDTAPVAIREGIAVTDSELASALPNLCEFANIEEATIVSTCNRTEIYWKQDSQNPDAVLNWLCQFNQLEQDKLLPYLYTHQDQDAVEHAFSVASGLDSMILGEPQILGQMKTAFANAHKLGHTSKILNRLFQQTFSVAKLVRTSTAIGSQAVSVAYAAVSLARQIFADVKQQTVILIGAGETVELACRHLRAQGAQNIIIANRSLDRAEALAESFEAEAISLDELPTRLSDADIIFSSTASTLPILGKGAIESALKKRKNKPMFLVDLAIPRDIEEEVGELANVYLYTLDDLQNVVDENIEARRSAAKEAQGLIGEQVGDFMQWFRNLESVPTIRSLRDQTYSLFQDELEAAKRRIRNGQDPQEVIDQFARTVFKKVMHTPTENLRKTQDESLILATQELFNIPADKFAEESEPTSSVKKGAK